MGKPHPEVLIGLGEQYDFRERYERARRERDPELCPHIHFRNLAAKNDAVALGFLQECGPLFRDESWDPRNTLWVDLNDFWLRHARFVAISRLWESRDNPQQLECEFRSVHKSIESINRAGPKPLGHLPKPTGKYVVLPWESGLLTEAHLSSEHKKTLLRKCAINLVGCELLLQCSGPEGIQPNWRYSKERDGFEPTRVVLSLWSAIWEMFGLDTNCGTTWSSCLECGKYFYPLQSNSTCCTPRHQELWSKREWARKNRAKRGWTSNKRRDLSYQKSRHRGKG